MQRSHPRKPCAARAPVTAAVARSLVLGLAPATLLVVSQLLAVEAAACPAECYKHATCNEAIGRCDCPKQLAGPDCSRESDVRVSPHEPCLNNCTGRGVCAWGECVCRRGTFGSDCSLSLLASDQADGDGSSSSSSRAAQKRPPAKLQLLAGGPTPYEPRRRRPHVYVYDIPHNLSSWHHPKNMDRGLHWLFWQRLLSSGAMTSDGEAADWYYIPAKLRTTSDGGRLLEAIEYVRRHWPWYDRLQGQRHFVIHTGDLGRGEVPRGVRDATSNLTWLHHWGLTSDAPHSGWKAAHRPGKDIVLPIHMGNRYSSRAAGLHPLAPQLPRRSGMLFVGRICGDRSEPNPAADWPHHCASDRNDGYSQGVRQLVHYHHHDRPGFKVATSDPHYGLDLLRYRWCLAPSGGGHGNRQTVVTLAGCLPVVVSDDVLQPFEPEMDWGGFGLRVAHAHVPRLHTLLQEAEDEDGGAGLAARTASLPCAAQHLFWSGISGAFMQEDGRWDAFEMTLEILRMQQTYPGLDPAQYAARDEQFRTFLHCGEASVPYGRYGMAEYGKKWRAAQQDKYGAAVTAVGKSVGVPEGAEDESGWEALYGRGGLEALKRAYGDGAVAAAAAAARDAAAAAGGQDGRERMVLRSSGGNTGYGGSSSSAGGGGRPLLSAWRRLLRAVLGRSKRGRGGSGQQAGLNRQRRAAAGRVRDAAGESSGPLLQPPAEVGDQQQQQQILPLCSISAWDAEGDRCEGGAPGGAACERHAPREKDLAGCPRAWP
ncbi:hypothetical protein HYH02_012282 [Chlamydomonas schloesseri]|uniref:EGF-like domain-containing protein n=1 Tax=Chlamydomonas schloesseri TaxID=2026947 RepID=A0A835SW76_9CHLO|nr:hypothetical protein HYH02_012282 [Chlamydomonas schloesseri]|eukprot:KAG2434452.1 hypothetical protein HYH02_012282 [Chlamydomonas schloesseri]